MEASTRDSTEDWLLGEDAKPPLLSELVERIEEALDVAYASEAAVESIGSLATEAATRARDALAQATVAAEHAKRSAEIAAEAGAAATEPRTRTPLIIGAPMPEDPSLKKFSDRADRVSARLRALTRIPLRSPGRAGVS
jgi:hypothetical protein